jgi:outer membrane protein
MKKHILALCMLCTFANASAQFLTKGTHLISGSFSFSSYTEKYKYDGNTTTISKDTEVSFLPNYGYLVMDNLSVGGGINFTSDKTKYEDVDGEESTSMFTIGPIVRYYISQGLFGQGYFGFGTAKEKYDEGSGDSNEDKYSVTEWRLGLGYSIKLSETVLLDPMFSYGSATWKNKDTDDKYLSDGHFMVQVGFTVFFPN